MSIRNLKHFGSLWVAAGTVALVLVGIFSIPALADGPYVRPPGPPPPGTPISTTTTAPPAPFASPKELYEHIRKELGSTGDPSNKPDALPDDDLLKKKVDALLDEYRKSQDAKRKQELKKLIKDAELDREARKHEENVNDFVLRRKSFIADVVDGLLAISVVNQTKDLRSVFRCGIEQMRTEFLDILKDLPAKEVLPYMWQKLEEQIRYSGSAAEARVAQLDAEKEKHKARSAEIRGRLNQKPAEPEKTNLEKEEDELNRKLDQIAFDRMIASPGVNNRNGKFITLAEDLIAGYGATSLDTLIPVLYGQNPVVKARAGGLIRRAGLQAVPRLIEAYERTPNEEIMTLLAAFAGKNLGKELKPWRDWWASIQDKVAAAPKNDPAKPPADKPPAPPEVKVAQGPAPDAPKMPPAAPNAANTDDPAVKIGTSPNAKTKPEEEDKPDPDEWIRKLKDELKGLRQASERLRAARQRHAEAMLFSNALERQLDDNGKKKGEVKEADPIEAELRKQLADALRREYAAKLDVDKAQAELDDLRKKAVKEEQP
ncbi:MAG: hypothetical protein HY291_24145 [Planctomycetes bacterium]|nr:hypothetical protein [Planctomycetota bacterium]